jgi:DNA mismatch repair protein MutS
VAEPTPLMRQHAALKAKNPDALLLFRLGDFYELFEEDARRAAPVLELVLTQRQGIPMCGLPHHALPAHLGKLLRAGLRVAIAEQMEDPAAAKGMVARDVVRVVTPGTVLEEELLNAKENNFLAAVRPGGPGETWGLAWADMSTGELVTATLPGVAAVNDELGRLNPREILWPEDRPVAIDRTVTPWAPGHFVGEGANGHRASGDALAAVLAYVKRNQPSAAEGFRAPREHRPAEYMVLDEQTVERLDLLPPLGPRVQGGPVCLWDLLDHTATAMGGRRLKHWLLHPLMDPAAIQERQRGVAFFLEARRERRALGDLCRGTADVERILARLSAGTATGRDLGALRRTLRLAPEAARILGGAASLDNENPLRALVAPLAAPSALVDLLERALAEDPPFRLSEGGVIRDGYSAPLDELRGLAQQGRGWVSELEASERQRTGISSLKVGFTSVFGYYLEVSRTNLAKVPPEWIRKQTLANAERFVTPDLKAQEDRILGAEEKAKALERELLADLRAKVVAHRDALWRLAEALGTVDALAALAEAAERGRWTRPKIVPGDGFLLEKSRHPVVERVLEEKGAGPFVPNDVLLDGGDNRLWLVTGPNMGGKSTFLRQTALAAVLAQMGSYVPAEKAVLGLVDRVFTRIGAGDNLAGGASTFLVEMREVATILAAATPRSLIVLDEVGRGTSTYDGVAVAWAVAEHLLGRPETPAPKVLFATHYFELTALAASHRGARNVHAAVREWTKPDGKTELVFLHRVLPGPADRSYGVHVAQMAGLPPAAVARARGLLKALENGERLGPAVAAAPSAQGELFAGHPALDRLRAVDPDRLTPMEALALVAELRRLL